ncbi:hypothetical protein Taro_012857 [Colocasia esculenta]|uniref:Uncharacterized protein n=1 Tax=Colocasia esculenta TaxID=4460 RepID=A0A843UEP7_COLES|nr:hypothetical protein [Colocasia esculenta]
MGSQRATTATGVGATTPWRWNSPVPYLFGGRAATMGLFVVSVVVLLCCKHKPTTGGSSSSPSGEIRASSAPLDAEPKVVVIMAGEAVPSFLAKAVPSLHPEQQL